jgi:hypothetical protein
MNTIAPESLTDTTQASRAHVHRDRRQPRRSANRWHRRQHRRAASSSSQDRRPAPTSGPPSRSPFPVPAKSTCPQRPGTTTSRMSPPSWQSSYHRFVFARAHSPTIAFDFPPARSGRTPRRPDDRDGRATRDRIRRRRGAPVGGCDSQDEAKNKPRLPLPRRPSHLSGSVTADPDFSSECSDSRSGSQRLGSQPATEVAMSCPPGRPSSIVARAVGPLLTSLIAAEATVPLLADPAPSLLSWFGVRGLLCRRWPGVWLRR